MRGVPMSHIAVLVCALLIGVVAGLRALTAPAVVSWAAFLGWVDLDNRGLHWLGHPPPVTVLPIGAGVVGGGVGTVGGYELRSRLVAATGGRDLPIALLEDVIAVGGGFLIVYFF